MPGERAIGSRCCVAACLNYQLTSAGVVFHKFPRDSARLIVWTDIVRRWNSEKPWSPKSRTMICSDHFLPECYQRDLRLLCDAGFSTKYARLEPNAVPSILVPRSSPPQTADESCVKRRRTGSGDHCSSSTVSKDSSLPMVTTWDDDSEAPTYESSLDAPVARDEPVGQNQAKTACLSQSGNQASASGPGCNSSTAASCDTVPATTAIDGHFGPHLESSICRICMCVVTRGTRTLSVDKAVQAFEELCQTSTENPALPTSFGDKGAHLTGISCLPEPTTSILFKCCFCTHVTGEQRKILSHLTVHGDEQLKCQHFPNSFYRVEDLRHHSEIHKLEGTFECTRCPAAYQKYAHLVNHIRMHAVEKPF